MLDHTHIGTQQGFSMMESLISLCIVGVLLSGVTALTLKELFQYHSFVQKKYLSQQLNVVTDIMRQDLKQAGFNGDNGYKITPRDSDTAVTIDEDSNAMIFSYLLNNQSGVQYRTIVYRQQDNKLLLCEKHSMLVFNIQEAQLSTQDSPCYSVFDPKNIHLDQFRISQMNFDYSRHTQIEHVSIFLAISLVSDATQHLEKTVQIQLRYGV